MPHTAQPIKGFRRHAMRIRRLSAATCLAVGIAAAAGTAPAWAAGAQHGSCEDAFGPGTPGVVITTPSGNVNLNCGTPGHQPAAGNKIFIEPCSDYGLGKGNVIFTPSGHIDFHCAISP